MTSQAQSRPATHAAADARALSNWLFLVAALVFLMVVVGGITRLTESGLSMTHWDPVSGAIPPHNAQQWQAEFDSYRATPEYLKVNRGMTLGQFKHIFFWEYVHRLLGRLIGLAYALVILGFAVRRAVPKGYGWRLVLILALGGLQGAIGWWMVESGMVDRPDVSHIRLAVHLLNALLIYSYTIWTALDLRALAGQGARGARMPTLGIWTLCVLALQLMFGAYVAGLNAGFAFNSWPMMGDEWFPSGTPMLKPLLANLADNPIVVQFVHRWLAFLVAALVLALAARLVRQGRRGPAAALAAAVTLQILLGIFTLLSGVGIAIAVSHQAMAVVLLTAILVAAHRLGRRAPGETVA